MTGDLRVQSSVVKRKRIHLFAVCRAAACLLLIGPTLIVPANIWHAHEDCGSETCESAHFSEVSGHNRAAVGDANLCIGCVAATLVAETPAKPIEIAIPVTPERALVGVLTHVHLIAIPGITSRGPPTSTPLC